MMPVVLVILLYVVAAVWVFAVFMMLSGGATMKRLPALAELPRPEKLPRVSVIVPARNEAARIGDTVRRLFAQQQVEMEVIVVDDRSTDGTSGILEKLKGEFPHLIGKRVETLPEGWLGKCHAMHEGAKLASGDWLLFSDGDIHLAADVLARAVAAGELTGADHVTLTPTQCPSDAVLEGAPQPAQQRGSLLYQAAMTFFAMAITMHLGRANRDRKNSMAGIGAFNLVRKDAYWAAGGHEKLRLEVADDMKLGLLLRRHGKRTRSFIGHTDVQCDWATSAWGIVKALEKNMFAAMRYSVVRLVAGTMLMAAMYGAAVVGLFYLLFDQPHPAAIAAIAGPVLFCLVALVPAVSGGFSPLAALLIPAGHVVMAVAMWNSALKTLRQGGIRWRDTFYPLAMLRAGLFK